MKCMIQGACQLRSEQSAPQDQICPKINYVCVTASLTPARAPNHNTAQEEIIEGSLKLDRSRG